MPSEYSMLLFAEFYQFKCGYLLGVAIHRINQKCLKTFALFLDISGELLLFSLCPFGLLRNKPDRLCCDGAILARQ